MAGDWIKVEKATARKPEVLRLADLLNIHPDHAFGLCVRFWFWCDDQLDSCHAPSVTNVTLDCVVGHTGFATALLEVGWLHARNGSLEVPNFDRHLSDSAKKRADSLRRKQKQRAGDVTKVSHKKCDIPVTKRESREIEKENITLSHSGGEIAKVSLLENPQFQSHWDRWCRHQIEKGKMVTTSSTEAQLFKLTDFDVQDAIDIIAFSIERNATNLILNGDHKRTTRSSASVPTGGKRKTPTFEEVRYGRK